MTDLIKDFSAISKTTNEIDMIVGVSQEENGPPESQPPLSPIEGDATPKTPRAQDLCEQAIRTTLDMGDDVSGRLSAFKALREMILQSSASETERAALTEHIEGLRIGEEATSQDITLLSELLMGLREEL